MSRVIRRIAPIVAVLVILGIDRLLDRLQAPLVPKGLLDEMGHLLTGLLFFLALIPHPKRDWLIGVVIGSTLIDLDHIPLTLGWDYFSRDTVRPYSHSLLMIGILAVALPLTGLIPRSYCWCVAFGIATHLPRDMATGGVPLFWPVTKETITLPHETYAGLLVLAAVVFIIRKSVFAGPKQSRNDHPESRT